MAFATTANIHSLCGNKEIRNSSGTSITSTVLADAVSKGDSRALLKTGTIASDWDTSNPYYHSLVQAAEYFGAEYVLIRYFKNNNFTRFEGDTKSVENGRGLATEYLQKAKELVNDIRENSTTAVVVAYKNYKSYPLNPDATPFTSLGLVDVTDDTTLAG